MALIRITIWYRKWEASWSSYPSIWDRKESIIYHYQTCACPSLSLTCLWMLSSKFSRNVDHHRVREAFEQSLAELDCGYIDLYLMHWPQAAIAGLSFYSHLWCSFISFNHIDKSKPAGNIHFLRVRKPNESPTYIETYKEMEKLLETGKVKSIGVSNFSIKTLESLLPHVKVVPAVNQVEVHPCLPQEDLRKYCEERGILIVAYSPLGLLPIGSLLSADNREFQVGHQPFFSMKKSKKLLWSMVAHLLRSSSVGVYKGKRLSFQRARMNKDWRITSQ